MAKKTAAPRRYRSVVAYRREVEAARAAPEQKRGAPPRRPVAPVPRGGLLNQKIGTLKTWLRKLCVRREK